MKNKNIVILAVGLVVVAIIVVLAVLSGQKNKATNSEISTEQIRAITPVAKTDAVKKIFANEGIASSGFASTNNELCFIDKNKNLSTFDLKTSSVKIIASGRTDTVSAKIVGTDQSCLFVEFGEKTTARLWVDGKIQTPNPPEINWIDENQNQFAITQNDAFDVYDASWKKISSFSQSPANTFALAAVGQNNAFAITGYDFEAATGTLTYLENGKLRDMEKVSTPYRIKANDQTVLMVYQKEDLLFADLLSKNGALIKSIEGVDSNSIVETPNGYYLATKPAGMQNQANQSNSLIYISNEGKTTSILSSVDQSQQQYNVNGLSSSESKLFYQDQETVYGLDKPSV